MLAHMCLGQENEEMAGHKFRWIFLNGHISVQIEFPMNIA